MESTTSSSTSKYIRDFESLFVPIKVDELRDKARTGQLRHCQFRSLCWRYFLHCLPERYDEWLDSCATSRQRYLDIKAKHAAAKRLSKQPSIPLGADTGSSENNSPSPDQELSNYLGKDKEFEDEQQYVNATNRCDHRNVYRTIERDVVRTFPDMEFFRQTEMQSIMENVLFNYASENNHLSYKQGMHELLATLLYVLHTDSQNCLINHQGGYANDKIATLLDLKYLEHDVFHLFCALMKSIESWYQNDEILFIPETSNRQERGNSLKSSLQQVSSVLSIKLKMISENIVKTYDPELFYHLEALQIAPQIYGIRWMRLMFGREFEFLDLLTVWDAIICDTVTMSLTDYIFASMLVTIRDELVNGDYTDCLNNLMRHQFKDVQYVIKLAFHLRDPANFARPKSIPVRSSFSQLGGRSPETSLTSKLSQQYISTKKVAMDNRDSRNQYNIPSKFQPQDKRGSSSGIRFQNRMVPQSQASSANKFLPNINRFVTSIGHNIQEKSGNHVISASINRALVQQRHPSTDAKTALKANPIKEYEMREMQSPAASSSTNQRAQLGQLSANAFGSKSALNLSTESYDDLHSIVDYCWRLLSEQIDSLQRCLPKEKSLHSEDEIFVALAQLKKVRDVLKGSLRLEDELEGNKP